MKPIAYRTKEATKVRPICMRLSSYFRRIELGLCLVADGRIIPPLRSPLNLFHASWIPRISIHLGMLLSYLLHTMLRSSIHHSATFPRSCPPPIVASVASPPRGSRHLGSRPPIAIILDLIAIFLGRPVILSDLSGSVSKARRRRDVASTDVPLPLLPT